jgi:hypothetical protein
MRLGRAGGCLPLVRPATGGGTGRADGAAEGAGGGLVTGAGPAEPAPVISAGTALPQFVQKRFPARS